MRRDDYDIMMFEHQVEDFEPISIEEGLYFAATLVSFFGIVFRPISQLRIKI